MNPSYMNYGGSGAYGGSALARGGQGCSCGVAPGEECAACGVSCGGGGPGAGNGALMYVGHGQGQYMQETTYKYVGYGGDFNVVRPRRDFTCIITLCCLLSLLFLIPFLMWLFGGAPSTSLPFDCDAGYFNWREGWSVQKQEWCCKFEQRGCPTMPITTVFPEAPVTQPPTPFPTPPPTPPTTTPYHEPNCALGDRMTWPQPKKDFCCRVHHIGCSTSPPTQPPPTLPPTSPPYVPPYVPPTAPPPPADPYNCAEGWENWVVGWSVGKKTWCCRVHGKGCPGSGGCATTNAPYDCAAGFENWIRGWSVGKKQWCCQNQGKGCQQAGGGCV